MLQQIVVIAITITHGHPFYILDDVNSITTTVARSGGGSFTCGTTSFHLINFSGTYVSLWTGHTSLTKGSSKIMVLKSMHFIIVLISPMKGVLVENPNLD